MSLVGNLEDLGLGEILQIVSLSRKSGVLALHGREREGRVVFRQGMVVRASSSCYKQNIGEVLVQKGILDVGTLKQALTIQEAEGFTELLGTVLIRNFGIAASSIEEVVREQIENVVYSLFAWAEGNFDFELQESEEVSDSIRMDPLQFMLEQGLNPQFLAMEGSRIIDEMRHRGESPEESLSASPLTPAPSAGDVDDFAFDLVQSTPPVAAPAPVPPLTDKRLLVMVDDDAAARMALVPFLGRGDYTVSAFGKSEETLIEIDTLYRAGKRPTVLVDLVMPRMDGSGVLGGVELLELIHNNFPDLPVLAMADCHNSDAERKVRKMGFAFIMKPRKAEFADAAALGPFADRLLAKLGQAESGEGLSDRNDKVNIGDELRFEMGEEPAAATFNAPQSTGISLLRGMMEELYDPALGGGIILLVLRFASEFMNRAVVFFVRRDEIAGLGQFGIIDQEGLAESRVRNLRIPRGVVSLFSPVIESQLPVKIKPDDSEWNRYLLSQLGGDPVEVFLGPIVSEGKVVAVLYGDNLPEKAPIGDTDALEIFLSQAGLAMEKALLLRRLKEKSPEGT
ncbi:MAG TPA: response regulator [Geobacteraceae bacterium]|nr:response regulator [Geobacteraceae bacterium]